MSKTTYEVQFNFRLDCTVTLVGGPFGGKQVKAPAYGEPYLSIAKSTWDYKGRETIDHHIYKASEVAGIWIYDGRLGRRFHV